MTKTSGQLVNDGDTLPLGYWPAINAHYHRFHNQSSLLIQVFAGSGEIDTPKLAHSLDTISKCHPYLNCQLVNENNRFVLRRTPNAANQLETLLVDQLDYFEVAKQALAEGIGEQLWRVVLVRPESSDNSWALVMVCHHAIGDAQSMNSFFDHILKHYSGAHESAPERIELPAMPDNLKIGSASRSQTKRSPEVQEWRIDSAEALETRQVGWLKHSLPANELEEVLAACRRETVWLTNLITVALLRANGFTAGARVATAVDIRRRVRPPVGADCFGCYAGVAETVIPYAEDIWEHARSSAASQLTAQGTLLTPPPKGPILKLMMESRINNGIEAGFFAGGCAVSNVGTLPVQSNYGNLNVEQVFVANRQLAGLYGVFLTISIFAGKLDLSISYAEPLVSAEHAQSLLEGISGQLKDCCK